MTNKTIDLTPSWSGILPYLLVMIQDGPDTSRAYARTELERMAKAADAYNDMTRSMKPPKGL